ncbi:MAG: phosphoribosyl-AMP cyclohydrolase [Hyphomicrobiaceae bacterium]
MSDTPKFQPPGTAQEVEDGDVLMPRFGADGTLAAIATDAETGDVLMFAWMNAEALALTIETGEAHFYSRSRQRIWKKGEDSGNVLDVVELRADCDQDAVWMRVKARGKGAACHTGHRTCFYRRIPLKSVDFRLEHAGTPRDFNPADVYGKPKS